MAPTKMGKDLGAEEKPETPSYDNAESEVAPALKDVDVVEVIDHDSDYEDNARSVPDTGCCWVPEPQDPQTQCQAFEVGDQARLPRRGGPPMAITIVKERLVGSDWEYHAEDSERQPVNTIPGGVGYEWIKQRRLIKT